MEKRFDLSAAALHILAMALMLVFGANAALAQDVAEATATEQLESVDPAEAADVANPEAVSEGSGAYTPMAPTEGKGMPVDAATQSAAQAACAGRLEKSAASGLMMNVVSESFHSGSSSVMYARSKTLCSRQLLSIRTSSQNSSGFMYQWTW